MMMVWFEREKDMRVTLIQCFSPEMTVFGKKVFLELFVKVEKDWRNRENKLRAFGYIEQ